VKSHLLDALSDRVLVYDGAMGTQLQAANLAPEDFTLSAESGLPAPVLEAAQRLGSRPLDGCNEILNFTRPDVVQSVHEAYFRAGADLVETNTFGATSIVLAEYDIAELDFEIAKAAAQIARRAADRFEGKFVVGAVGPGTKLATLGQTTWEEAEGTYYRTCLGLIEGGSDALLLETMQDLLLVKAAVVAANRAMAEAGKALPLFVQVTMEQTGTMLLGSEIAAALNSLECFPSVQAVGLNCATGPQEMAPHVRFLGQHSTRPISVLPNAGLPEMEKGRAVYRLTPEALAEHHTRFVQEHGVAMCGGCCGTTPAHIETVAEAVKGLKPSDQAHWRKVRRLFPSFDFRLRTPEQADAISLKGCSSLYQFTPYEQDNSFLIVGEKTNANGSKAFREMLASENWEGLVELAREQEAEGSHVLDVCAAYVGRDEARDMSELLFRLNKSVNVPIMIDSTEVPVMERALQCLAGKPILNSINFEDGEARARKVLELATRYGAALVGLTIDEDGMAKTRERKLQVAERILSLTRSYGVPDHDVFLDCLTFTLGSGDEEFRLSAVETIEAIREVKRVAPRVQTILGISNVSFGLRPAARQVLNSVFLEHCREAGLTSAIVHFSKLQPRNRVAPEIWKIAEDLVYDRRVFRDS
jgi:5-methyltetrahydrofolate--homocysteine methyltransferase